MFSVHSETTGNSGPRGSIFYDAECPLCRAGQRALGIVFTRRGFEWVPLQTPGTAERLRISEAALREEMKLLLPDHRVVGGMDSWVHLLRAVWWLWPVGALLSMPGLRALGRACYRWVANHRYCLFGRCRSEGHVRRTIPFLDLP